MEPVTQGWAHRLEPDNKVFLIDLKATPPKVIGTITVGKQPSGMAISPKGDLALVANRADGTISVLSIRGKDVLVVDTVTVGTGAVVGAGAIVTKDVAPYSIVVGVPAKPLRERFPADVAEKLLAIAWWDWPRELLEERFADFNDLDAFLEKYTP